MCADDDVGRDFSVDRSHHSMFFRKSSPPAPPTPPPTDGRAGAPVLQLVKDATNSPAASVGVSADGISGAGQTGADFGLVLDALGSILATFARYTFDLPDRPASESAADLARWQRHTTLGVPMSPDGGATAAGVHSRDWTGVVRSFTEHRRDEKRYVDSAIGDLRDALWSCIQTVHNAVRLDVATDSTVAVQMQRAHHAISKLQVGSIKDEVVGALATMQTALQTKRSEQEAEYKSLASHLDYVRDQLAEARRESTTDALTGLGNRKQFDTSVTRAVHFYALDRTPVTLLMIDVDDLKVVNDTCGHQGGDLALVGVANALVKVFLRQSDTLCRFGGDEFVAVLHNTDTKMAQSLAKRLVSMVAELPSPEGMPFKVGVSVGIAEIRAVDDAEQWLSRADRALYSAKQNGRSCVVTAEA